MLWSVTQNYAFLSEQQVAILMESGRSEVVRCRRQASGNMSPTIQQEACNPKVIRGHERHVCFPAHSTFYTTDLLYNMKCIQQYAAPGYSPSLAYLQASHTLLTGLACLGHFRCSIVLHLNSQ